MESHKSDLLVTLDNAASLFGLFSSVDSRDLPQAECDAANLQLKKISNLVNDLQFRLAKKTLPAPSVVSKRRRSSIDLGNMKDLMAMADGRSPSPEFPGGRSRRTSIGRRGKSLADDLNDANAGDLSMPSAGSRRPSIGERRPSMNSMTGDFNSDRSTGSNERSASPTNASSGLRGPPPGKFSNPWETQAELKLKEEKKQKERKAILNSNQSPSKSGGFTMKGPPAVLNGGRGTTSLPGVKSKTAKIYAVEDKSSPTRTPHQQLQGSKATGSFNTSPSSTPIGRTRKSGIVKSSNPSPGSPVLTGSSIPDSLPISTIEAMTPLERESYHNQKLAREAFALIDINGDGFLQASEVLLALKKMAKNGVQIIPASMEVVEQMMAEVDIDGDGQIDLEEFMDMMKHGQKLGLQADSVNGRASTRMSALARNVLLAHKKNAENNVVGKDWWLIHPHDWRHAAWDVLVSLLILITVVTLPLSLGWEINLVIDVLFMVDVVKNFMTGYIDENEFIVMDKKAVVVNYLTGYFMIDLLSSFPIDPILDAYGIGSEEQGGGDSSVGDADASGLIKGTKSLKMFKLLRMAKLFRLLRLSRLFRYIQMGVVYVEEKLSIRITDGFTKLIKLAVGALLIGHWLGSFNFMICRLYDFPEDSWVVYAGLIGLEPKVQWSWSFFKAMAQMIMIGFETPPFTNVSCDTNSEWCAVENWITLVCLYIGAVFYSLLISSISGILQTANISSRVFEEKLGKLDDYMRSKKFPAVLREKVKDYYHLNHTDGKLFDEEEILSSVTPLLRREIVEHNNREVVVKVPLLQVNDDYQNQYFASEVAGIINPVISFPDEVILRENTTGNDMFFISSGVVEIYVEAADHITYVAIGDGCYCGEVSMILNCKRTASARTKTQCMLYRAEARDMMLVLDDFPDKKEYMESVAKSRQKRIINYLSEDSSEADLAAEDKDDREDCKTELFGIDADEVMVAKDEHATKSRERARISIRSNKNRMSGGGVSGPAMSMTGAIQQIPRQVGQSMRAMSISVHRK